MELTFKEAEFLAQLFDATLSQLDWQKQNLRDYTTALIFMGKDLPDDENEIAYHLTEMKVEIFNFREKIRENYGI